MDMFLFARPFLKIALPTFSTTARCSGISLISKVSLREGLDQLALASESFDGFALDSACSNVPYLVQYLQ